MKRTHALFLALLLFIYLTSCNADNLALKEKEMGYETIKMTINTYTFRAKLFDNETATAFKTMLPLTLTMRELNGNEKYFHFSSNLPTHPSNPMTIYSGDLMLWGNNSFVLFYETFSTSYAYTRIGRIEDITNLIHTVGKGDVMVKIELE